jgi:WD40 repeat protein
MVTRTSFTWSVWVTLLSALAACVPGGAQQPPVTTARPALTQVPISTPADVVEPSARFAEPTLPNPTPQPAAPSPTPTTGLPIAQLEPLVTAAQLSFLGWSPDGEIMAYVEHTPADLAVLPPFPPGRLKFLDPRTGQTCDTTIIFPEGDYSRSDQITWLPHDRVLVNTNGQVMQGTPCGDDFTPVADSTKVYTNVPDPTFSPAGGHRARTEVRDSSAGILDLVTTLVNVPGDQVENVIEWRIDERLGDLGLGGEWLTEGLFLIYETLNQGPLLVPVGEETFQVAPDLFGISDIPSMLGPEEMSLRATAAVVTGTDTYHIILAGVGIETNFPPIRLYHSETGQVEELPFRYTGSPAFSPDGLWLVLDARPIRDGYESSELWLRPVDPAGSQTHRLAGGGSSLWVWSPDWTRVAVESGQGISIYSVPDGSPLGLWQGGAYNLSLLAWSPTGEFLAVSGYLRQGQGEGLFVIAPAVQTPEAAVLEESYRE